MSRAAPTPHDKLVAASTCAGDVLRGQSSSYAHPAMLLSSWFMETYRQQYIPVSADNGNGCQSISTVVWLASTHFLTQRVSKQTSALLLAKDGIYGAIRRFESSYDTIHEWTRGGEYVLAKYFQTMNPHTPYAHTLDRVARIAYWNAFWGQYVCSPPMHECVAEVLGLKTPAARLETLLATYMRDYEFHEDSDSKFVVVGRDIVTRVMCEAASTMLCIARNSGNIGGIGQVEPITALVAPMSDTSDKASSELKSYMEGLYKQLLLEPGRAECWDRILAGWLLFVFAMKMQTCETEHASRFSKSRSVLRREKRKRHLAANTGSGVRGTVFMQSHVVTNFDWGTDRTDEKHMRPARGSQSMWRPKIVQFRDHWFVLDYIGNRVIDCGVDNRHNGSGCIMALTAWTHLICDTNMFSRRLANGCPLPVDVLACIAQ